MSIRISEIYTYLYLAYVLQRYKKDFCNLIGAIKLIINEQDITVRTCKKVEHTTSKLYENKRRA